jgi:hypothetical protein
MVLVGVVSALYAEAPELRTVMPNSWKKVTRLTQMEEKEFLQKNGALLDSIAKEANDEPFENVNFLIKETIYTNTRVYKEQVGSDTFYRLLVNKQRNPAYTDQKDIHFLQALVYDRNGYLILLVMGTYNNNSK